MALNLRIKASIGCRNVDIGIYTYKTTTTNGIYNPFIYIIHIVQHPDKSATLPFSNESNEQHPVKVHEYFVSTQITISSNQTCNAFQLYLSLSSLFIFIWCVRDVVCCLCSRRCRRYFCYNICVEWYERTPSKNTLSLFRWRIKQKYVNF